jgi:heat shock protein HslJ
MLKKFIVFILLILLAGIIVKQFSTKQSETSTISEEATSSAEHSAQNFVGAYNEMLSSASGVGRTVTLVVRNDNTAMMTTDYQNDELIIVESGNWKVDNANVLSITINEKNYEDVVEPYTLNFIFNEEGALELQNPENAGYGSEGLTLTPLPENQSALLAGTWHWTKTQMSDGKTVAPNSDVFILTFNPDNMYYSTTDCNSVRGGYEFTDTSGGIKMNPGASTMMYCEGSQESLYVRNLTSVNSYTFIDGQLVMMLPYDSGSMVFVDSTVNK